jgi:hypothetical protein
MSTVAPRILRCQRRPTGSQTAMLRVTFSIGYRRGNLLVMFLRLGGRLPDRNLFKRLAILSLGDGSRCLNRSAGRRLSAAECNVTGGLH